MNGHRNEYRSDLGLGGHATPGIRVTDSTYQVRVTEAIVAAGSTGVILTLEEW